MNETQPPVHEPGVKDFGYEYVRSLAKRKRCRIEELLALAKKNDPFFVGAPAQLARAEWFARLWDENNFPRGTHLRRVHYRLLSGSRPVMAS